MRVIIVESEKFNVDRFYLRFLIAAREDVNIAEKVLVSTNRT